MLHFLITPQSEGPDSILQVSGFGKQVVQIETLDEPVEIAGEKIVGYPKLSRYDMNGNLGAQAYHILVNALEKISDVSGVDPDFAKAWGKLCSLAQCEARCVMLLVNEAGRILLYTFDAHAELEDSLVTVYRFEEPTMYQQGRILTLPAIMEQLLKRRREKDEKLQLSFDATDDHTGFDIHELDLE